MGYIKKVLLPKTNETLKPVLTYGEFLRWIGLWLLMSTADGCLRREFWSIWEVDIFKVVPFGLNLFMDRNRFEDILPSIRYIDKASTQPDKFYEVSKLIKAWNDNMAENFQPSWISCLDESMSVWTNPHTCPGYMYVPRKPWPFGNEYHTIRCGKSTIMYAIELVEGKDSPADKKKSSTKRVRQ
jgi:Transposase IS4